MLRAQVMQGSRIEPKAPEPETGPLRSDRNPRGRQPIEMQPVRFAARAPDGMPGRRGGSDLGWLRWGLLLPVLGFTAWAASGIFEHGLNGSWRNEESLYRIETSAGGAGRACRALGGGAARSARPEMGRRLTRARRGRWERAGMEESGSLDG